MRIIHSSDFHLDTKYPERTEALDAFIRTAQNEKPDLALIAGDFFNSNVEAEKLRPLLREKFSSLPFKILLIPGNHDSECYLSDLNFGNDIEVLTGDPFEIYDLGEIRIVAVPYKNQSFINILPAISNAVLKDRINILLIHCTLDIPYLAENGFGDEKKQNYLPVSSKVLAGLNFDYIMAGHFHSRAVENKISEKSTFLYSGSPVSISKKESCKRSVYLLDTSKKGKESLRVLPIDSFYYNFSRVDLRPGKEDEGIKRLEAIFEGIQEEKVDFEVTVSGLVSISENELKEQIEKSLKKFSINRSEQDEQTDQTEQIDQTGRAKQAEKADRTEGSNTANKSYKIRVIEQYRSIKDVIGDPLYKIFKEKLLKKEISEEKKAMIDETVMLEFSKMRFLK